MKLLERLAQAAGERRDTAAATYRELLSRADNPQRGDEAKLAEVMAELGIGPADVARHLEARRDASYLLPRITSDADLDALDAATRTARAVLMGRAREMMKRMIDRIDDLALSAAWSTIVLMAGVSADSAPERERQSLVEAATNAEVRALEARRSSDQARRRLDDLRASNALAFND